MDWQPKIGDPTWIKWLTVGAYLIPIWFRISAGIRLGKPPTALKRNLRRWGLFVPPGCFLLDVNKQLDLQRAFIEPGGQLAPDEGWHKQRRLAQLIFVLLLDTTMTYVAFIVIFRKK